jgi:glycosyltransferase involved in cell wall biosynthesis
MVDGIDVVEFDLSYSNYDSLLKRSGIFFKFAFNSIRLALAEPYDVLFATTTPLTAGIPGIFARWLRHKPFVFEVRDLWPELPREMGVIKNPLILWAMSALEWLSYRSATRCVALSPGIAKGIERRGVQPENIAMVPNGCDLELFRAPPTAWRPAGVEARHLLALFTGAHGMANGLEAVLDAAEVLKARGRNDVKLLLIGDGKMKPALMATAEQRGLHNVIFHDPVPKTRLSGLLAGSDLGLQILADVPAFYYGTSPNKFFDYVAAGLPILNNYPGWLAEVISAADCGFVVPPRDAVAFADALEQAADDRSRLREKGINAVRLAGDRFDRAKLADEWVAWVTND